MNKLVLFLVISFCIKEGLCQEYTYNRNNNCTYCTVNGDTFCFKSADQTIEVENEPTETRCCASSDDNCVTEVINAGWICPG